MSSSDQITCPNCGSTEVGTFTADDSFKYGVTKPVTLVAKNVLFFRCTACNLEYTGEDAEQKRERAVRAHLSSKTKMHPNANRKVTFDCFWQSGCSDSARCNAHGSCVAATQAGGAPFAQQMEPDTRPLSHMEILSAVAHHAREIARLTAALPVKCTPDETGTPLSHVAVADRIVRDVAEMEDVPSVEDHETMCVTSDQLRDFIIARLTGEMAAAHECDFMELTVCRFCRKQPGEAAIPPVTDVQSPVWRGYCECKWDATRSRVVEAHPACRFHGGSAENGESAREGKS
jgi:hypothetical protein